MIPQTNLTKPPLKPLDKLRKAGARGRLILQQFHIELNRHTVGNAGSEFTTHNSDSPRAVYLPRIINQNRHYIGKRNEACN